MPDSAQLNHEWHRLSVEDAAAALHSDPELGLTDEEAGIRLAQTGPNLLTQTRKSSIWKLLAHQFNDVMILILIVAAVIAGLSGGLADTLTITAILLLNAAIGFSQELRAVKAMQALHAMAPPDATVLRNGKLTTVPAQDLVPGDIVTLEAGDQVPADLRLTMAEGLLIEEAALTGESVPSSKDILAADQADLPLGSRNNLAFKGTLVTKGRALGLVFATGMATELGHIADLIHSAEQTQTPLQKRLRAMSKLLVLGILGICLVIFVSGLMRGESLLLMLLTTVSLAVAAIPESLPAVVTIALALGAYRLAAGNALMRNLQSVETLGSVTRICTDKTGTLTLNQMQVEQLQPGDEQAPTRQLALQALALCNDALSDQGAYTGDPTETALLAFAEQQSMLQSELAVTLPRIAELPFDSARMRMTTFHQADAKVIAFTKGAPEAVLPLCIETQDRTAEATMKEAAAMAADGMRVLALAYRYWPEVPTDAELENCESQLHFLGLAGLLDPPRTEAADAISTCQQAGITVVMITGDHPATALAISKRLGLAQSETELITGDQLDTLDDEALKDQLRQLKVIARANPAQKIRIVRLLQELGEFVAMTGDGVNDAPALKQADIGVAMGCSGTDVAREASDMILLDDNFTSIVTAIRGGRRIYANIRRFIRYVLTTNLSEVLLIFIAPLLGMPLPLLPIHILWINLVSDGLPGLALTAEPAGGDLMQDPPRPPDESLFAGGLWQHMIGIGTLMCALALGLQVWGMQAVPESWQTLVFTALTFSQLAHVMAIRSEHLSLWQLGLGSNPQLLLTVVVTVGLQLGLVYIPVLNSIFATTPLSLFELMLCLGAAGTILLTVEAEKWAIRQGWLYQPTKVKCTPDQADPS